MLLHSRTLRLFTGIGCAGSGRSRCSDGTATQDGGAEKETRAGHSASGPAPNYETAPPSRSKAGEAKVKVTQFKLSGNTVIPTEELEALVASSIGKEMTVRELNEVAETITEYYAGKDYFLAQAYLPTQQVRGGVVEIAILEGNLGKVIILDNARYKTETIVRYLEPIQKGKVFRESTLETALNELNMLPGLRVRADLKPGEVDGSADLTLRARERIPHTVLLDIDNYGSRFSGPWLYGAEIGIGNISGIGDNLSLRGIKSDDNLFFTNITYLIPVTSVGTKLQLTWVHSENVIGEEFAALRPVGRADVASVDILQTITRTGGFSLTAVGGFDFKTVRNITLDALTSKDELRVFRLGLRGDYRDPYLGRTYFGLTWHYGVDFWGGSEQNAPQTSFAITDAGVTTGAGPGTFSKGTLDFARFQSLNLPFLPKIPVLTAALNDSYLVLRGVGQIVSDRLLSSERFAIGGYYTVRGYPIGERIGDHGYSATAELVVPVPSGVKVPFGNLTWKEMFQVVAFIDHGGIFVSSVTLPRGQTPPLPQEYLTGAGGGLRINLPFGVPGPVGKGVLTLKIDWASAIGRPRPSSRDQGISLNNAYGDGAAGTLYVSAALRF